MRRLHLQLVALLLAIVPPVSACDPAGSAERAMRKQVVGDWVMEMDFGNFVVTNVLTLRPDSRWTRVQRITGAPVPFGEGSDSGNFRIQGVTLNLHSEVEPAATPFRYTISGDTLFQANAAQVQAITGHDIGEQVLVRVR